MVNGRSARKAGGHPGGAARIHPAFAAALAVVGVVVLMSGFGRAFAQQPAGPVEIRTPFWRVGGGFETSLLINNTISRRIVVKARVYDASGQLIPAQDIELGPLVSVDVDLGGLLNRRAGYGWIALRHDGRPLDVAAQVMIHNRQRNLMFNQGLLPASQHAGNQMVGVSDFDALGGALGESLLVIANAGEKGRRVTVEAVVAGRRGEKSFHLESRQTRLLQLMDLFDGPAGALLRGPLGIRVRHDGSGGDVMVHGLLMGAEGGLAANLRVTDRAKLKSRRALSPALRPAARQKPWLALYNAGTGFLTVTPTVHFRVGSAEHRLDLTSVLLAPDSAHGADLSRSLDQLPPGSEGLGLSLKHDGRPGSLVAELLITDAVTRSVAQASPKDALGETTVGMTFAWRLGGEDNTVIALVNPGDEEITLDGFLTHKDGTYHLGAGEGLRPGEVRHIDIRRLRDKRIEDEGGAALPSNAVAGQAKVFVRNRPGKTAGKLVGQAIQIGGDGSLSAFLSCPVCPPGPSHLTLSPSSLSGNIGTNKRISPKIHWDDGSASLIVNPSAVSWDVDDTGVATVSEAWNNFRVNFKGVGETEIDASASACQYEYVTEDPDLPAECVCQNTVTVTAQPTATATTNEPSLSCPLSVTRGNTLTARVSNLGNADIEWEFLDGGSTTVDKSGGSSWSGKMVTSGRIRATISPPSGPDIVKECTVSVKNRSGWKVSAVSANKRANGYRCSDGTVLGVASPPTGGGARVGASCLAQYAGYNIAQVSGGPNAGYWYVTSISNSGTEFSWAISSAVDSTSSAFYQAQCGDYNSVTNPNGFISGANLRRNTIRHESGSSQSHYANYRAAQNKSANNVGIAGEKETGEPSLDDQEFRDQVDDVLISKHRAIRSATVAEPYSVQHNASGVFQGNVNFLPYEACEE